MFVMTTVRENARREGSRAAPLHTHPIHQPLDEHSQSSDTQICLPAISVEKIRVQRWFSFSIVPVRGTVAGQLFIFPQAGDFKGIMCCCFSPAGCSAIRSKGPPSLLAPSLLWLSHHDRRGSMISVSALPLSPQSHTHKLNSCHGTGSSAALSFLLAHPPVGDISAADNTQRRRRHGENGGRPHKLSKQGHQRLSLTGTRTGSLLLPVGPL